MASGDDFWEKSDVKGYNFDEDESNGNQMFGFSLDGVARLSQQIKAGFKDDNKDTTFELLSGSISDRERPELHNLISEKSLNAILDADLGELNYTKTSLKPEEEVRFLRRQLENRWKPPDINSVMKNILLGQPYTLEVFKSLDSKTELLKAAETLGDGDAILMVVLFLAKTLKKSHFQHILSTSPIAVDHYVHYLNTRMQIQELSDVLEMLGRSKDAAMRQFVVAFQNPQRKLERLKVCSRNHFSGIKEKVFVENYIKLLEWQNEGQVPGNSVLDCLGYVCQEHWGENKGVLTSPHTLAQAQGISERQFQWVALTSRAKLGAWQDMHALFITKGWLGGKKVKSILPMDQVVYQLHKFGAPTDLIVNYIDLIDNYEKKLTVAKTLHCHKSIIDIHASQRDRQALLSYKANLHTQSEDYFYAESILRSQNIKWKN